MITDLRQALTSLRNAQLTIENDIILYKKIDDIMAEIECVLEEKEGGEA
jgi:hypothetical protein